MKISIQTFQELQVRYKNLTTTKSIILGVLRGKIKELESENSKLAGKKAEIDETIEKLSSKITSLKAEKTELQKSITKNNGELNDLKKELDRFEQKFTNLSINPSSSSGAGTVEGNICKKCVLPYDQILDRSHSCITTCGHQFCEKCLKQMFTLENPFNFPINQELTEALCPTCSKPFKLTSVIRLN